MSLTYITLKSLVLVFKHQIKMLYDKEHFILYSYTFNNDYVKAKRGYT